MRSSAEIISRAKELGVVVPAFNIPYLPMMEPVIQAIVDTDSVGLIEVSRIEWTKFEARGPAAIMEEFHRLQPPEHVRLHLDHVPVVDEDELPVDYVPIIEESIALGYQSVMIDGSRLDLEKNIEATRQVVELAHEAGIPCEAELGAVFGHGAGPPPPYEELYATGLGFTDVDEARRFVADTNCDWLSVAVGSIHGAVSAALRDRKKPEARLNLAHLDKLAEATGVPLVLHGGSGVKREYVLAGIKKGIAKVNIGTEIRQTYERELRESGSITKAQVAVFERTSWLIRDYFEIAGDRSLIDGEQSVQ